MALPRFTRLGSGPIAEGKPAPPDPTDSLIEALAEPLLILDGYHISHANAAARALLGEHIVGDYVRLALRHPAAAGVVSGDEDGPVTLNGLGGHERLWELRAGTIRPGKRLLRLTDRSAQRAAEQMRVDFVANASHELRTPLATIVGYAETLREAQDSIDPPTRARFAAIMHEEARRMQRVVEDLISLSRIEAERFSPPPDRLSLAPLIELAAEGHRRAAEERQSKVIIEVEPNLPQVPGDRSQLLQVFENLVSNALRYGKPGTPVTVLLRREGDFVRIAVKDEGEGVPAELIPRLTERFYRIDTGRSRALGGTGLGLAIVKHIVERHRGRLEIDSRLGRGTTVSVLLPRMSES
jgi:two-component system phosphate regulon sensor histidine kinase PhoR